MIKLLHLYRFNGLTDSEGFDYSGLWETVGVVDMESKHPIWSIRRVASFTKSPVGEQTDIPQILLESYANKVDRAALQGVPVTP